MPDNNVWRREVNTLRYKAQDFENSCFPACLQMALENFYIIGPMPLGEPGRPIEDACWRFCRQNYNIDIAEKAPTIEAVLDFIGNGHFPGRGMYDMHFIVEFGVNDFQDIINRIQNNLNIAIIGAIKNQGGHATMILKKENVLYAVNPQPFQLEGSAAQIALENIVGINVRNAPQDAPPVGLQCVGPGNDIGVIMDYCFVITPNR